MFEMLSQLSVAHDGAHRAEWLEKRQSEVLYYSFTKQTSRGTEDNGHGSSSLDKLPAART